MLKNLPKFSKEAQANIEEIKSKLIREENKVLIHGKTKEVIINFALEFTAKYFDVVRKIYKTDV